MPTVFINNEETDVNIKDYSCLSEMLEKIYKEKVPADMVVTGIELNSEKLSEEQEREYSNLPSEKIKSLNISVTHIQNVVYKTLKDLSVFLVQLISDTEDTAEIFRVKGKEEANKKYEEYLEGLQLLAASIDSLFTVIRVDRYRGIIEEDSISSLQNDLLKITNRMHDSQMSEDWIMLADLLEYELLPHLEECEKIICLLDKDNETDNTV